MELKKCPICGFPNDKSASLCEECDHKFIEYFDDDEEREVYHKEHVYYEIKKKKEKIDSDKREFSSLVHLFGFFLVNVLIILSLIGIDKKWGTSFDIYLTNAVTKKGFLGFDSAWFIKNLDTIKYISGFTFFQLIYNIILFKHIDSKKVLILFNVFVVLCLMVVVIVMFLLK
ncbi:MAG: hypothetical protein K8S23_03720 [Candidatus Cloacimonetes bacterium]|nr:hypothetical protein [Candidatus Cloacimonadota bacterium]